MKIIHSFTMRVLIESGLSEGDTVLIESRVSE